MNSDRSATVLDDGGLRLPRPPGLFRRFWANHPVFADVLIATTCLVLAVLPLTTFREARVGPFTGAAAVIAALVLVTLSVATCVLLLRRRQYPVIVYVAAVVTVLAHLLVLEAAGSPLLFIACYTLAVHRSAKAAWVALAWVIGLLVAVSGIVLLASIGDLMDAVNNVIGIGMLGLIGTLIGANVGGRRRYLEALVDRSRQLMVERDQQAQLAAAAERARIAREMHDIVSHSLTVVVALSEGAAATEDRHRAADASLRAAETARAALTEMRAMLGVLRDGDDAPLAPSVAVSPQSVVEAARRAGFPVTLTVTGDTTTDATRGAAIGRIVQEGVTNAMRHAPAATRIDVRIEHRPETVLIEVSNDGGRAGTQGTAGFGLRGLHERAAHAGGHLTAGPTADGWTLKAALPAPNTENA